MRPTSVTRHPPARPPVRPPSRRPARQQDGSRHDRALTHAEQLIIDQRVALQRKMFEEYEQRERRRKVAELQELCPDLTAAEATAALELCGGREDAAADALVSDPAFRQRIQVIGGARRPVPPPAPGDGPGATDDARRPAQAPELAAAQRELLDAAGAANHADFGTQPTATSTVRSARGRPRGRAGRAGGAPAGDLGGGDRDGDNDPDFEPQRGRKVTALYTGCACVAQR